MTTDIDTRLAELDMLQGADIRLLGTGESNTTYIANNNGEQLVVRLARQDVVVPERFARENQYLEFVNHLGFSFSPKPIYCDADRGVQIVSFMPGKDGSVLDLNPRQQVVFIDQIKRLDAVSYDSYLDWCKATNNMPYAPNSFEQRIRVNFTARIEQLNRSLNDPRVAQLLALATDGMQLMDTMRANLSVVRKFMHNDLRWTETGGNLRIDGEQVGFIDWELTGFVDDYGLEIGDVLGSIPLGAKNNAMIADICNAYKIGEETDPEMQMLRVAYAVLWGRIGNPLWAAERYVNFGGNGSERAAPYATFVDKAMQDLPFFLETPYKKWFSA